MKKKSFGILIALMSVFVICMSVLSGCGRNDRKNVETESVKADAGEKDSLYYLLPGIRSDKKDRWRQDGGKDYYQGQSGTTRL